MGNPNLLIVLQILDNVIFLSFLGLGVYFAKRNRRQNESLLSKVIIGLSFGLVALVVTTAPLTLPDGATVDARAGPVILAGVLAGPIGGLTAAVFGALGRSVVGGSFAFAGIVAFFLYAVVGVGIRHFRLMTPTEIALPRNIGFLVAASVFAAGAIFFVIQPMEKAVLWLQLDLPYIVLANALSVSLAAVVVGITMHFIAKKYEIESLNETLKVAKNAGGFGIWDYDIKTDYLKWDDRSAQLHGLPEVEFIGSFEDWARTVHPDDLEPTREAFSQTLEQSDHYEAEYRVLNENGSCTIILGTGLVLRDAAGVPTRMIGTNLDLTELRAAEASLTEAQSQAVQSQKFESVGQLTGGVAHDFNNLLAIIMGNQELLQHELDQQPFNRGEADELIEASLEATRRGAELTQNMLSYARKARLVPVETDINTVVRETEKWLRRTIEARIEIETVLQDGLWLASVDRVSLQNALVNLLVNARDAFDGSGQVTIETSNVLISEEHASDQRTAIRPGSYVMLAVTDNGNGISPEIVDQIFDPFFTTKPTGQGSGLGLSMVQGFVKQSGGTIRVNSEVGAGTRFKLYFPATQKDVEAVAPTVIQVPPPAVPAGKGRILLVEDQLEVLTVMEKTLRAAGYDVVTATSGDDAFAIFQKDQSFDLVATDIVMPGERQGPRLASDIRSLEPDIPFLFLSGYASEATVHGNGVKPDDIRVMKPVSHEKLLESVRSAIANRA
jgi:signal transduction histidine kinase